MIATMLVVFIIGYIFIALEHKTHINKTAISLVLGILLWTLYIFSNPSIIIQAAPTAFQEFISDHPEYSQLPLQKQVQNYITNLNIIQHIGNISEILFYLLGAMVIVEVIDSYHGFEIITRKIKTNNRRKLLWIISLITFFMSSVLDNMTSAIIMILVIQKLLSEQKERWLFGGLIIIAANAGGAWTPIGDVTTIMLWIHNNISSGHIMKSIFLPSLISLLVPLVISTFLIKKEQATALQPTSNPQSGINKAISIRVLSIGVLCLLSVPLFKSITTLPPFAGIMLALGIFWIYTDFITPKSLQDLEFSFTKLIAKTDFSTILFFLGILMAVAALESIGILHLFSLWLDLHVHNIYLINLAIGLLSAIIDNVPLVAAAIGMYPIPSETLIGNSPEAHYLIHFVQNGDFWNLLAFCAGTGGSLLIIGSAAGVVVMGLEKINFIWYTKKITWQALLGFLAGLGTYYLLNF